MRRAAAYFAVGVALFVGADSASANVRVTGQKVAGTGLLAGYDIWQLSVFNDGTNGTASPVKDAQGNTIGFTNDVQAWDVTVSAAPGNVVPAGQQQFWFYRTNASTASPTGAGIFAAADLQGTDYNAAADATGNNGTPSRGQGSFIAPIFVIPDVDQFGDPAPHLYAPNQGYYLSGSQYAIQSDGSTNPSSSATNYATAKGFRTAASYSFINAGHPNDRIIATNGVRFGNVIVPAGNNFSLSAQILPNALQKSASDPAYFTTFSTNVPEPTSLGFIGLGLLALGRRRRQA